MGAESAHRVEQGRSVLDGFQVQNHDFGLLVIDQVIQDVGRGHVRSGTDADGQADTDTGVLEAEGQNVIDAATGRHHRDRTGGEVSNTGNETSQQAPVRHEET